MAKKENLKYIHSTEAYWVKNRLEKDRTNCHMVIAAKNAAGRGDINFALSVANEDGYYYKPRIDLELLFNIPKDNIIVISACIAGWNYKDAEDIWLKIHGYFGKNFFLEVQYHNTDRQKKLNEKILRIAEENNIQIICGLDSHYIKEENAVKRSQILKYKNISYPGEDGWYMDYPDTRTVIQRFKEQGILSSEDILRAVMNTNVFVSECENIVLDRSFKIPSIYKDKTYKEKCKIYKNILNAAYSKEKEKSKEKAGGIRYEAREVMESGVVDYFLTSKAIVDEAVNNQGGILTTTSRGSAASFITNKLLGLTTVDRFNADVPVYPERFLTKERVLASQMPDIDLNVATQEPFVRAAKKLAGEHGCYPLMAVEKLKEKAAWQLYAGANDVKPEDANQISKYLDEYNKALKYADDEEKDNILAEDYIPLEYINLFRQSNGYQGITINLKVHACGYFIFDGDIRRETGLISAVSETTGKRTLCAAIEGGLLDEFGYVKEDFLIVDSVGLTYKFFQSIGMEVPSFNSLRKMIDGDKAEENGLPFDVLAMYGNETEKQFNKINSEGLLNELIQKIPYRELSLKEKLDNQREVLGILTDYDPGADRRLYYVSVLDVKKSVTNIFLYEIYSGRTREVKMWTNQYNRKPFSAGDILYIISLEKKNKKEPAGGINQKTGKKIYMDVPGKFEYWLGRFMVKNGTGEEDVP